MRWPLCQCSLWGVGKPQEVLSSTLSYCLPCPTTCRTFTKCLSDDWEALGEERCRQKSSAALTSGQARLQKGIHRCSLTGTRLGDGVFLVCFEMTCLRVDPKIALWKE